GTVTVTLDMEAWLLADLELFFNSKKHLVAAAGAFGTVMEDAAAKR
ncbi:hypothetical protein Tco_0021890, partial [Tanacetum coccineum]